MNTLSEEQIVALLPTMRRMCAAALFDKGYRGDIEETALDLAQEAIINILRKRTDLKGGKFGGYMWRCAVNKATDFMRKRSSRERVGLPDPETLVSYEFLTTRPQLQWESNTLNNAIAIAFSRQPQDVSIFVMSRVFEIPYEVLVGIMDSTYEALKSSVYRASKAIRQVAKNEDAKVYQGKLLSPKRPRLSVYLTQTSNPDTGFETAREELRQSHPLDSLALYLREIGCPTSQVALVLGWTENELARKTHRLREATCHRADKIRSEHATRSNITHTVRERVRTELPRAFMALELYEQDSSYKQVATTLGIRSETVKTYLIRARRRISAYLDP